jgi:hypothetical protein
LLSGVCVYIYFGLEKKDISRRGWGNLESVKFNRSAGKQGFWLFYVLKAG